MINTMFSTVLLMKGKHAVYQLSFFIPFLTPHISKDNTGIPHLENSHE